MGLAVAQLMNFYGGALTYKQILSLTLDQFYMFMEYMAYMKRWESGDKKAIAENKKLDRTDNARWP